MEVGTEVTDQQWTAAMAEITSLRFQLTNNIMPLTEREDKQSQLARRLRELAEQVKGQRT